MKKFFIIIFLLFFIVFIARSILLYNIEPIGDHSFYIWWIDTIINSEHFFPVKQIDYNFIDSIKIDKLSFIHNLLLPIYISVTNIFTTVSLLYFSFGNIFFEDIVASNIVLSIFANSLVILMMPIYLFIFRKNYFNLSEVNFFAVLYIFLISSSSFFFAFSTQGPHNLGILFLYLYIIFFSKYLLYLKDEKNKKKFQIIFLFTQFLAFYSMYTNIFLIPFFIFANLMFFSEINFKKKIFELFKISLFTFLILTPGLIALILIETFGIREDASTGFFGWGKWAFNFQQYSSNDINLNSNLFNTLTVYFSNNFKFWFEYNAIMIGRINLLLALLGIILFKFKYNNPILLSLLVSHLFISLIMVGFNNASSRTYAYILPLLYFGIALIYFEIFKIIKKFKNKYTKISLTIFFILFIILYQVKFNFYKFLDPGIIKANWSQIYKVENKELWKKLSNTIVNTISENSLIIAPTSTYKYFLDTQINNTNYIFFSSLDTLKINPDTVTLLRYKSHIEKVINNNYKIYFLSFDKDNFKSQEPDLYKVFCKISNQICDNKFKLIKEIKSKSTFWQNLYLFELSY